MKPLREWTQRWRTALVVMLAALVVGAFYLGRDTGPTRAETQEYDAKRAACVAMADASGVRRGERTATINNCLLGR